MWEKCRPYLAGLANKFSPALKEEKEDLMQEIFLWFLEMKKEEQTPDMVFVGMVYRHVTHRLLNLLDKRKAYRRMTNELADVSFDDAFGISDEDKYHYVDEYLSFPKELRQVANLLLFAPVDFVQAISGKEFKSSLLGYLRRSGWEDKKIKDFWNEFGKKSVLSNQGVSSIGSASPEPSIQPSK